MNDALHNHLEFRKKYGIPAKTRTRFAWLPVRLYTIESRFVGRCGFLWLRQVTEITNSAGEWIAFDEFQEKSK